MDLILKDKMELYEENEELKKTCQKKLDKL